MRNKLFIYIFGIGLTATIYYNGINDSNVKLLAMGCLGVCFVAALFKRNNVPRLKIFKSWTIWCLLIGVVNFLYGISAVETSIIMPLMVAYTAYKIVDIDEDAIVKYMLPICLFSAFSALYSVYKGLGGFEITSFDDNEIVKNQIGAAFATVAILSSIFSIDKNLKKWQRIVYIVISVLNIYPALFFSCRTALLCYFLCVGTILFVVYRFKALLFIPILVFAVVFVGGSGLQQLLFDSIVGERDTSDADALTSGRITHAMLSIDYFIRHPLMGFYGSGDSYATMPPNAHIFLLYRLTKWGILGSIPFIALYISIFKIFICCIKDRYILLIGGLMIAFIESFAEYAPPFGPGSCFVIVFAFIGVYLRKAVLSNKRTF